MFRVREVAEQSRFGTEVFHFRVFPFLTGGQVIVLAIMQCERIMTIGRHPFAVGGEHPFTAQLLFEQERRIDQSPRTRFERGTQVGTPVVFELRCQCLYVQYPGGSEKPCGLKDVVALSVAE